MRCNASQARHPKAWLAKDLSTLSTAWPPLSTPLAHVHADGTPVMKSYWEITPDDVEPA
jgi:hypothetical protein